jgi:DNA mismatch repair ATPase MutL
LLDEGKIKDASEEEFRNRLIKRALYRAVPTKKKLSPPEIDALLKNLFQTKKPYVSPHGQRIVTRMTKTQWERLFEKGF